MTRRAAAAAAVGAATLLVLSGCASDPTADPAASPAGSPSAEAITGTLTVFAAASLTDVFEELASDFEARHPEVEVVLSFGGSSGLAQQIVEGAPADVFASANEATMATVDDAGLATEPVAFASNTLQLIVPAGNPGSVTGLDDLARDDLVVALCDPAVPCGAAASTLLDLQNVTAIPDTLEQDVKAVATKVALGEVDAGLVYVTDARAAGTTVESVATRGADEVRNEYLISSIDDGPNPAAATAWLAFLDEPGSREILTHAGFGAP